MVLLYGGIWRSLEKNHTMKKIFFSQQLLDSLSGEGKIKLDGNSLTLLSDTSKSFALEPAYRIIRTADGSADPNGLVGKIKSGKELQDIQAEAYLDSVICGETAYQADPGFLGEETEVMAKLSDTDILARFLLENLI